MNGDELRALQKPLKDKYTTDPSAAVITMRASGTIDQATLTCRMPTSIGTVESSLHPAAGGPSESACSGDILLQALVACAGVTLSAVSTAMGISLRSASIEAEGDVDFRGTLGLSRETPIGMQAIRMKFQIDSDASPEQLAKLVQLVERYCVILQTMKKPPEITVTVNG